ncbi:MAG: cyclic nucleotide-binding domain-containing protein [Alphaproteobacteria bacterium]|nr:cyclic nucleotide-binding domain-containing protein [Alphaproteobacteria bacterium]
MRPHDFEMVRRLPLMAELPQAVIDRLIHGAFVQSLPRGTMLCVQGESPEFLHLILSGRVTLLGSEEGRGETVVEFFEVGDMLVAPAVLLNAPYLMSARVAEDGRILFIPATQIRRAMSLEPDFSTAMAMQLARYWRRLVIQIKDLKLHASVERLAAYLNALVARSSDGRTVQLPEDRKLVAARLGMTPESLSRAFAALRKVGVTGQGRTVTIGNVAQLRDFCRYEETI